MEDKTFLSTEELIDIAKKGYHRPKELLQTWAGLVLARELRSALRKVSAGFKKASKQAFDAYIIGVKHAQPDVNFLMSSITFENVHKYYMQELKTVSYIIKEYYEYLDHGHFIKSCFFNEERAEDDQFDFLELKNIGE